MWEVATTVLCNGLPDLAVIIVYRGALGSVVRVFGKSAKGKAIYYAARRRPRGENPSPEQLAAGHGRQPFFY